MITVLMGKSASGKNAIEEALLKDDDIVFERLVSSTTRPIRKDSEGNPKEKDGIDYNFLSKKDFLNKIGNDEFIEFRSYHTSVENKPDIWFYGLPKQELDPEKNYITILDVQGTQELLNYYGRENCFVVNVETPDNIRESRAKEREGFDQAEWDRRLKDDTEKFSDYEVDKVANFNVDNSLDGENNPTYLANSILYALEAYKEKKKEKDEQYIVIEQNRGSIYGEEEWDYTVVGKEELMQAEKDFATAEKIYDEVSSRYCKKVFENYSSAEIEAETRGMKFWLEDQDVNEFFLYNKYKLAKYNFSDINEVFLFSTKELLYEKLDETDSALLKEKIVISYNKASQNMLECLGERQNIYECK